MRSRWFPADQDGRGDLVLTVLVIGAMWLFLLAFGVALLLTT